ARTGRPWLAGRRMATRWLVYHVASGQSFFSGAACLLAAVCVAALATRSAVRLVRNSFMLIGGALVFVSATPFPRIGYLVLAVVTIVWLIAESTPGRVSRRSIVGLRFACVVAWTGALAVELPYHVVPRIPAQGRPVLGIIGDSVTAGTGDDGVVRWPAILAARHGIAVRDHSQMGATVRSALGRTPLLEPS